MTEIARRKFIDKLVSEVENRVLSRLGSMAFTTTRIAVVAGAINAREIGSVYLGNDTSYASPNFRNATGANLAVGQTVLVVIDPVNNDRYISHRLD